MGKITDTKNLFVEALQTLDAFSGDAASKVYPYRELEPETAAEQAASKVSGLAAFVSVERIQKLKDGDPVKRATVITDIWMNVWNQVPSDEVGKFEDLIEQAIPVLENLVTEQDLACGRGSAFQDAFRITTAPKPFLVYRIITNIQLIISN